MINYNKEAMRGWTVKGSGDCLILLLLSLNVIKLKIIYNRQTIEIIKEETKCHLTTKLPSRNQHLGRIGEGSDDWSKNGGQVRGEVLAFTFAVQIVGTAPKDDTLGTSGDYRLEGTQ